ncbi:SDR family NAD(P)-dependent oxidoreductase [Denitratisoma oestradiolicum]|uniref:Oxidoreductase n=1 Tax=Denitratisoma oestradiolicum TaxID=311182 RepID=A0A6S6XRZ2_9PROT|nr:SDR family NAD(P)-dependent oxidoreductase [Denitratisoma oestradiolicum]CAB1368751.1 Oxidoreductase [Denitratisoma oestradiolicum]
MKGPIVTSNICFKGGTAVITGAAGGVGGGLARKAASLGMNLVLADLDAGQLDAFAATLDTEVLTVSTDVTDPIAMENLAEQAWQRFGRVDLLFNNAGVMSAGLLWEISPENFRRCFSINVLGIHHGIRAFVPRMLKAGCPSHIVNTASLGGFVSSPMMAPYNASKSAAVFLTEALYVELNMVQASIGVSVLDPGPVRSGIFNAPFGDGGGNPAVRQFIDGIHHHITGGGGITPDQSAENTFAGIEAGEFWILPYREPFDTLLRQRTEGILARRPPRIAATES